MDLEVITNYISTGYINDKIDNKDDDNKLRVFGLFVKEELKKVDNYKEVSNIGEYINNLIKDIDNVDIDEIPRIMIINQAFRSVFEEYENLI